MLADICAEADTLHEAVQAETDRGQFHGPAMRASRDWDEAERIAGLPPEQLRCLLFAAAERFAQGEEYSVPAHLFWHISQRPPDLEVGDVRLLAAVSEPGTTGLFGAVRAGRREHWAAPRCGCAGRHRTRGQPPARWESACP